MLVFFLVLSNIIQFYFVVNMFLYFFIAFTGLFIIGKKDDKNIGYNKNKRFAILVPAHNEKNVIKNLLDSLLYIDYPKELYDIYIICDHCSDDTEDVVIKHPLRCNLFVMRDNLPSNKARALNWATDKILRVKNYDAFCYFDADSLIHPQFLKAMSKKLNEGCVVIQGQQIPKNTRETIISLIVSSGQFITNYFFQKPKEYLGLSATLHGKGICFSTDVVRKFRWDEECLTEDLEMQMRLISNGIHINWCEDAIVYDEQPLHISQYVRRSVRWTRGSIDTAKKHSKNLFIGFLKTLDLRYLEGFIYCFGVYRVLLVSFCSVAIYLTKDKFNILLDLFYRIPYDTAFKFLIIMIPFFIFPFSIFVRKKVDFDVVVGYFMQPILGFLRVPIFLLGVFRDKKNWGETYHVSRYTIFDLVEGIEK